jgi:bla regulator protein BlaR1
MEHILYNISQVVGISVIHSLWQGLLIFFVLRFILGCVPSLSSAKKYSMAVMALGFIATGFIYTLCIEAGAYSWSANAQPDSLSLLIPYLKLPANVAQLKGGGINYHLIAAYLPYIAVVYMAGLLYNLTKLGWEWSRIYQIKASMLPAVQMQQYINRFSKKLSLTKQIGINFSELIDVPCMIGFFKPIILLPVSIATNLTACEIESILLHELSHIKRNDYLVNVLQRVITVLLFFNPCAQLINRIINQERENGCDDLVIGLTRNPLIYARALLKLEETRRSDLQLAMLAMGKKYHLLTRIERIMKTKKPIGNIRHLLVAVLLLAGSLGSIAWLSPKAATAKAAVTNIKTVAKTPLIAIADSDKKSSKADKFLHNKISIVSADATDDTTKKHKGKITIEDKDGNKKEYNSYDEMPDSIKTKFLMFNQHFNKGQFAAIEKFYSSPEWKKQAESLSKMGATMAMKFNSPEWKKQAESFQKMGADMALKFNSPEWKKQAESFQKMGADMALKFNSPEWEKQAESFQKMGADMALKFNSPEWKKQAESLQKMSADMAFKFNSPEWKKQAESFQKMGADMALKFNSPEWKKQAESFQKMGQEMSKKFNSPEWKKKAEEFRKQAKEMSKQFNSPEWKKQSKNWKFKFEDDESKEKPEQPEKPGQPEKKGEPEQPEKPEPQL